MPQNLKKLGLFCAGIGINGYCMFQAVKANRNYSQYVADLSLEEQEKLRAMDWFLKKHAPFYRSGIPLADNTAISLYNAKTDQDKKHILTRYRWATLKDHAKIDELNSSKNNP